MNEIWRPIPGFDRYEASTLGQIRRIARPNGKPPLVMQLSPSGNGYRKVDLWQEGRRFRCFVHRLVFAAFRGDPGDRLVDHRDRQRDNNRLDNLRCATFSQNRANSAGRAQFRGVCRLRGRWAAFGARERATVYLGTFPTAEEAAAAYDRHARATYGEFARLNFPEAA